MQFGTPVPLLIGLILIIGAVVLFFLDKIKPGYGRDADKVYSVLLLIAGMCALGELQLGIFPSFQLLIMAGMLITLLIENIRNREPLPPSRPVGGMPPRGGRPRPGDRSPPDRRPVYQAELDDWDRFDDRGSARSMPPSRGYEDDRFRARPPYDDRAPLRRLNPGEPRGQYERSNGARQGDGRPPAPNRDAYGPSGNYRDSYGANGYGPRDYDSRDQRSQPLRDAYPNGEGRPPAGRPSDGLAPEPNPPASRPSDGPSDGRRGTERTLDVRPYSEAPKPGDDGPDGEDYLDFRPVQPDGPGDDADWR